MSPPVHLAPVSAPHKPVLANLLQLYLYDFSEFRGHELGPHGTYSYSYLDLYFVDAARQALFILAGDRLAGFALLHRQPDGANLVAEFFVLRAHRRRGVGRAAATRMFRRYPGEWSLDFDHANAGAARFWPDVVGSVAVGPVERLDRLPPEADYPSARLRFRVADPAR